MSKVADLRAALALLNVIVEVAKESGEEGASLSGLFVALSEVGVSYREFEHLVELAVSTGHVRRLGSFAIVAVPRS